MCILIGVASSAEGQGEAQGPGQEAAAAVLRSVRRGSKRSAACR